MFVLSSPYPLQNVWGKAGWKKPYHQYKRRVTVSHFVTLTWLFFVSVKGAKGPIGPIGDLGTKGVEVMSPCCVVKMCVKFLYVERQIYDRKVYSLCGAKLI